VQAFFVRTWKSKSILKYLFCILEIKKVRLVNEHLDGILTPIPQPIVTDLASLILHSHCATMALQLSMIN
jgi:hypothetical protein